MDYSPEVYRRFGQDFSEVKEAYDALGDRCNECGPLDGKSRRLIKLGVAIGLSSEGAVRSHARRASQEGISNAEIRQAVLLSLVAVGFPAMIAAMQWVDDVIEKSGKNA